MTRRRGSNSTELMLSIGGVVGCLELDGAVPVFLDQVRARYGAFTLPVSPTVRRDFSLRLAFFSAPPPDPSGWREQAIAQPLEVTPEARTISARRWDFSLKLAAAAGRSRHLHYQGSARCEMNPYTLDCILRVVWSTLLPRLGGMLVHSCGLRHAEVAVVFPGASGAGKTTLARKAPDADDVLSDEMVAIRRDEAGIWRVHGTPFWGDFARGGTSLRSWPLRTVAFLSQAKNDAVAITPMTSAEATLRLLGCVVSFATDKTTVERCLANAVELCSEVRCVEASLTKTAPTATIFRKLTPHLGTGISDKAPPANTREMISEFRSFLRKHKSYAFKPKGGSMRPWLKSGDALFIQSASESELAAGDILLYWRPGQLPEQDALVCHRLVARIPTLRAGGAPKYLTKGDALSYIERFENNRQSEILGKVAAISRDGKTWPVPGRVGNLARLFGSLVAMPILRITGR